MKRLLMCVLFLLIPVSAMQKNLEKEIMDVCAVLQEYARSTTVDARTRFLLGSAMYVGTHQIPLSLWSSDLAYKIYSTKKSVDMVQRIHGLHTLIDDSMKKTHAIVPECCAEVVQKYGCQQAIECADSLRALVDGMLVHSDKKSQSAPVTPVHERIFSFSK